MFNLIVLLVRLRVIKAGLTFTAVTLGSKYVQLHT